MINEKAIENNILSYLKIKGIFAYKQENQGTYDQKLGRWRRKSSHRMIGIPDIKIPGGRSCYIEVKSPTGRVSPAQKIFMDKVNELGGLAFVARSLNDVEEKLKPYLDMACLRGKNEP